MPSFRMLDSNLSTYLVSLTGGGPVASLTDICSLQGAALKTVKVRTILVGGWTTTGRSQIVNIVRRSSANSGGTTFAAKPVDTTDQPAAAVGLAYFGAITTPGTLVAQIDAMTFGMVAAGALQDRAIFNYQQFTQKGPVLNNAAEWLCVNMAGQTTVADHLDVSIWWTEQ